MEMTNAGQSMGQAWPRYKCHKEVWALKIKEIVKSTLPDEEDDGFRVLVFAEEGYLSLAVEPDYMRKHKPHVGGYYIIYKDSYRSFSPAEAFEEGYTRL
jgi:hypothetical protein